MNISMKSMQSSIFNHTGVALGGARKDIKTNKETALINIANELNKNDTNQTKIDKIVANIIKGTDDDYNTIAQHTNGSLFNHGLTTTQIQALTITFIKDSGQQPTTIQGLVNWTRNHLDTNRDNDIILNSIYNTNIDELPTFDRTSNTITINGIPIENFNVASNTTTINYEEIEYFPPQQHEELNIQNIKAFSKPIKPQTQTVTTDEIKETNKTAQTSSSEEKQKQKLIEQIVSKVYVTNSYTNITSIKTGEKKEKDSWNKRDDRNKYVTINTTAFENISEQIERLSSDLNDEKIKKIILAYDRYHDTDKLVSEIKRACSRLPWKQPSDDQVKNIISIVKTKDNLISEHEKSSLETLTIDQLTKINNLNSCDTISDQILRYLSSKKKLTSSN